MEITWTVKRSDSIVQHEDAYSITAVKFRIYADGFDESKLERLIVERWDDGVDSHSFISCTQNEYIAAILLSDMRRLLNDFGVEDCEDLPDGWFTIRLPSN